MNNESTRRKIVRVELKDRNIVEFIRFTFVLSLDDMKTLENCITAANTTDTQTPIQNAIAEFAKRTGNNGILCPAPYLYDITLD